MVKICHVYFSFDWFLYIQKFLSLYFGKKIKISVSPTYFYSPDTPRYKIRVLAHLYLWSCHPAQWTPQNMWKYSIKSVILIGLTTKAYIICKSIFFLIVFPWPLNICLLLTAVQFNVVNGKKIHFFNGSVFDKVWLEYLYDILKMKNLLTFQKYI